MRKSYRLELKAVAEDGTFEGYASVFGNVDLHGDRIERGAFKRTLDHARQSGRPIPLLWQHHVDEPIGVVADLAEDEHGLRMTGRLVLETARAREAYALLRAGALGGLSIGFQTVKESWDSGVRVIREVKLFEISLVTIPANPEATVATVKGIAPEDVSEQLAPENAPWQRPALSDFTDQPWDELSDEEKIRIAGHYAWAPKRIPDRFTDLKLPHHRPSDGAVVWRGVYTAMAALLGARGGVQIPEADRRRVYDHLAHHYRQFDREPPEFRSYTEWELQQEFPEESAHAELREIADALKSLLQTRPDPGDDAHSAATGPVAGEDAGLAELIRELREAADAAL